MESIIHGGALEWMNRPVVYIHGVNEDLLASLQEIKQIQVHPYNETAAKHPFEYFLVFVLNPSEEASLLELIRVSKVCASFFCRRLVYVPGSMVLDAETQSLLRELRVEVVCQGTGEVPKLQRFIRQSAEQSVLIGSIAHYKREIHRVKGNRDQLLPLLDRVQKLSDLSGDNAFLVFTGYFWAQERRFAERTLRSYLAKEPDSLWAVHHLGFSHLLSGHWGDSAELFERLGLLNRLHPERYFALGEIYRRTTQTEQALRAYEHGLKLTLGKDRRFQVGLEALTKRQDPKTNDLHSWEINPVSASLFFNASGE